MNTEYEKSFLLQLYQTMARIREFETRAISCSLKGLTFGNIHPCVYQESIPAGAIAALEEQDYITASHRGHGQSIAKGSDTRSMMAELFGKKTGCCGGKGGSLHVTDVSKGILGANGIVGAGIPLAGGSALASKIRGAKEVTAAFFGDGASNQGTFHETMNMAAAWKLPMIFVCENNSWAVSVRIDRVTNTKKLSVRAGGYDIPGETVDGNDVLAVYEAVKRAADRARNGEGPSMVECVTYRVLAHNVGDPMKYRNEKEIADANDWKTERDPILLFRAYLLEHGVAEEEINAIDAAVVAEIDDAVAFATESEYPSADVLTVDVYKNDNERSVAR